MRVVYHVHSPGSMRSTVAFMEFRGVALGNVKRFGRSGWSLANDYVRVANTAVHVFSRVEAFLNYPVDMCSTPTKRGREECGDFCICRVCGLLPFFVARVVCASNLIRNTH